MTRISLGSVWAPGVGLGGVMCAVGGMFVLMLVFWCGMAIDICFLQGLQPHACWHAAVRRVCGDGPSPGRRSDCGKGETVGRKREDRNHLGFKETYVVML